MKYRVYSVITVILAAAACAVLLSAVLPDWSVAKSDPKLEHDDSEGLTQRSNEQIMSEAHIFNLSKMACESIREMKKRGYELVDAEKPSFRHMVDGKPWIISAGWNYVSEFPENSPVTIGEQ